MCTSSLQSQTESSLTDIKDGQSTTLMLSENVDAYYYIDQPVLNPTSTVTSADCRTVDTAIVTAARPNGNCTERGAGFVWWDTSAPR